MTIIAEFSDVIEHIGQFLAYASRGRVFKDSAVLTLEATRHAISLTPQGSELLPTQYAGIAKEIFVRLNLQ
jgi:hypothetical protein